ncbi:hypothetical protein OC834_007639 [Tilletia horrida]|nr:hypothetical protein OC834_007639 [Tilletia horrida]
MTNIVVKQGRALSESECAAIRAVIELQEHPDFKKSFEGWDKAQYMLPIKIVEEDKRRIVLRPLSDRDIDDTRRMRCPNDTCKRKAITAAMANQSKWKYACGLCGVVPYSSLETAKAHIDKGHAGDLDNPQILGRRGQSSHSLRTTDDWISRFLDTQKQQHEELLRRMKSAASDSARGVLTEPAAISNENHHSSPMVSTAVAKEGSAINHNDAALAGMAKSTLSLGSKRYAVHQEEAQPSTGAASIGADAQRPLAAAAAALSGGPRQATETKMRTGQPPERTSSSHRTATTMAVAAPRDAERARPQAQVRATNKVQHPSSRTSGISIPKPRSFAAASALSARQGKVADAVARTGRPHQRNISEKRTATASQPNSSVQNSRLRA